MNYQLESLDKNVTLQQMNEYAHQFLASGNPEAILCFCVALNVKSRLVHYPTHVSQCKLEETTQSLWYDESEESLTALAKLIEQQRLLIVNVSHPCFDASMDFLKSEPRKKRVNILGLGDVGSTMALALTLYGKGVIDEIGLFDLSEERQQRWEQELNQIGEPLIDELPKVKIIDETQLFDCDLFAFTASVGVPPLTVTTGDVRAVQFEGNSKLVEKYAKEAVKANFKGIFAVVSDPVDQLCRHAFEATNREAGQWTGKGLCADQIKGYGLGVMNGRAAYYARQMNCDYASKGRVYGPHGQGLVVVNDYTVDGYDAGLSERLTENTITANLAMRQLGFKPYVAPAVASGAIAITKTLASEWHYSCVSFNGFYYGCLNRVMDKHVTVVESLNVHNEVKRLIKASVEAQEAQWQSFW